jgi:hypothetical protein
VRPLAATALATAALLAAPLLTGCGGGTPDCVSTARAVTGQTDALESAIGSAHHDPRDAATALRRIQQHLDDIAGHTGNPDAAKAVAALSLAVSNAKNDLDNGVAHPDITPVTRAAGQLADACPSKG